MTQTETEKKLWDAAAQMKMALQHARDEDESFVRSCINAFISHARSVTFVMQKESAEHPELLAWYRGQQDGMKTVPLLRFFNEKRVHSIHCGVVNLNRVEVGVRDVVEITGGAEDGKVDKRWHMIASPEWGSAAIKPNDVLFGMGGKVRVWRFDGVEEFMPAGWSDNVFRLCEDYFVALKWLVNAWKAERKRLRIA